MADNVENLMLEHLRAIRADMSSLKDEMSGMRSEMVAIRHHMAGLMNSQLAIDGEIATLKVRLDRVEKRLELAD